MWSISQQSVFQLNVKWKNILNAHISANSGYIYRLAVDMDAIAVSRIF